MLGTVVVGVIFTDIKGFPTTEYVSQGRNLGRVEYVHGGVSRNVAENIAVSGMPVTFVSMTEPGGIGREAVERLDRCGVNTEFILPAPQNGIGKWMVVFDEKGEVAGQISCPPDMKPLTDFVEAYGNAFVQDADQIIIELDIGRKTVEQVLALAKTYGKKVYAVAGNRSVLVSHLDLLLETDCLICSATEFCDLFGISISSLSFEQMCDTLKSCAMQHGLPSVVVTLGDRGCVFYDKTSNRSARIPAAATDVSDVSGAGDAFLAGTVMGLSRGFSLYDAASLGIELSALAVHSSGYSCSVNNLPADFAKKLSKNQPELQIV